MSCPHCSLSLEALVEANDRAPLEGACSRCTERLRQGTGALGALRAAEPAATDATRSANVAAALARAESRPKTAARTPRARMVALLAAAAFTLLVIWFVRPRSESGTEARLETGSAVVVAEGVALAAGEAIPQGRLMTVGSEDAKFSLDRGAELEAKRSTGFSFDGAESMVVLDRGTVSIAARPRADRPLRVRTREAIVKVVGTKFRVTRTERGTAVVVQEGVVEVHHKTVTRLAAGDPELLVAIEGDAARPDAPDAALAAAEDGGAIDAGAVDETDASAVAPARPSTVVHSRDIRAEIKRGRLREARALFQKAQSQGARGADLELRVVEAELLLAEGKYAAAIDAYRAISLRAPRTSQGEEALFAAAQLLLDHGSKPRGRGLLEEYRKTYPRGRFRSEVDRLIDVTSK